MLTNSQDITFSGAFNKLGGNFSIAAWFLQVFFIMLVDWGLVYSHFSGFNVSIKTLMVHLDYRLEAKKQIEDDPENVLDAFVNEKVAHMDRMKKSPRWIKFNGAVIE